MNAISKGANPGRVRRTKLRWLIIFLAFVGITINYVDRANLAVALPYMTDDLNLSPGQAGLILGVFFWTYALFQIPLGWLVDRTGVRLMFAVSVVWWSIFTAATALTRGFASLLAFRLLLGVGEAGAFPSCARVVEQWFPKQERGLASGIYDSGARGGTLIATPLVAAVIAALGWRLSFVVTGALGLVFVVFWVWLYRSPRKHHMISQEELEYIEAGGAHTRDYERQQQRSNDNSVRWRDLFLYRTVWGMALGFFCESFIIYFFITWFPTYLVNARGFSLLELGFFGTIPALVAFAGNWLGGFVSDSLVRRGTSLTMARKGCIVGGLLLSSVIALAAVVPSAGLALVLLSISFGSLAFATSSIVALPADVAPVSVEGAGSWAGSIMGIQNGVANLAGFASPVVLGFVVGVTGSFVAGLVIAGAMAIVGSLIYLFVVGPIEPLPVRNADSRSTEAV